MSDENINDSTSENTEQKSNVIQQQPVSKNKVISSLIWKFLERGGVQGVQFVLSIILARLVSPEDYGVIAILLVFIQIATVFIQSGFNTALIQKKEADDIDFSSIFYLSFFVAAILYVILFFGAPLAASFYKIEELYSLINQLKVKEKEQNEKIKKLEEKINQLEKKNNGLEQENIRLITSKESIILSNNDYGIRLKNWINPNKTISFSLLYRMSRDGDSIKDFHKLCDKKGPTVSLYLLNDGNSVGG